MPIVPRQPVIVKREIRLEQHVNELLEDYAQFIDSSPEDVVNSVLKKMIAKDRDYKRWKSPADHGVETPSLATRKAGAQ